MAKDARKSLGTLSKEIAAKIRATRIEAGLTQEELATELGVSWQQLQKYERGANRITPDRLLTIAVKVGRPISYFFGGAPEPLSAAENELLAALVPALMSRREVRRIVARLADLNEQDAETVAILVERLASPRK